MQALPSNALSILEFDKVLEDVAGLCNTPMSAGLARGLLPSADYRAVETMTFQTHEVLQLLEQDKYLITSGFPQLEEILRTLQVPGYVLEGTEIRALLDVAVLNREVADKLDELEEDEFPVILAFRDQLPELGHEIARIEAIIDREGKVLPDASEALRKISRRLNAKRGEVDAQFQRALRKYADKHYLADTGESIRNGRRVLAVHAESKRKIRGIIHDQSATGRTAFVEPEEVIELNNDIFDLNAERRAEEYRLRKVLCDDLRGSIDAFELAQRILVDLDVIQAKAKFSQLIEAIRPGIKKEPGVQIVQGRHPLLFLRNRRSGSETVPFDLSLDEKQRILLLSGPNAGGKSILLKAVGLMQIMIQAGILVPVEPESEFGIFQKICADIGDQQSIEDDLSTYSSRLHSLRDFLITADRDSLLLIDEFGSGTDPKLGGAIAEAALNELNGNGVFGVITTHYSELKAYAHKSQGIINGAMIFDTERMTPTYLLSVGKPGSSFAFEIAGRVGMPQAILDYARNKAGKHARALEDLINELEKQKLEIIKEKSTVADQKELLDKLTRNYETISNELAAQRKRMRLEQKERDYQHLSRLNRDLEKAVRKAREADKTADVIKQMERVKEAREQALKDVRSLNEELVVEQKAGKKPVEVGDSVKISGSTEYGKVESIDKKYANVIVGQLRMRVPIKKLQVAGDPVELNPRRSVQTDTVQQPGGHFDSLLDIRGMRARDADKVIEQFMDSALLSGVSFVRIVHGKGTGALKKLVADKLRDYPVASVGHPEDEQGGSGITLVEL